MTKYSKSLFNYATTLLLLGGSLSAYAENDQTTTLQAPTSEWPSLWQKNYPSTIYRLEDFERNQGLIRLNDGSQWKVASDDMYKFANLPASGAPAYVVVSEGWQEAVSWGRSYFYTLVINGEKYKANIFLGSSPTDPYFSQNYRSIVGISAGNQVNLSDGTMWKVSSDDYQLFKEWQTSDSVIVGSYDRWFTSYDAILLNIDHNHYIRAKKL